MRVGAQLRLAAERIRSGLSDIDDVIRQLYEAAYREGYTDGKEDGRRENCEPMDEEEE